jgi:hypothetical protein
VNNLLHSLIKEVNVSLNGQQVNPYSGNCYAYRSYISGTHQSKNLLRNPFTWHFDVPELLDFDFFAKRDKLAIQGWADDTVGKYESEQNHGWLTRRDMFLKTSTPGSSTGTVTVPAKEEFTEQTVPLWGVLNTDFESFRHGR